MIPAVLVACSVHQHRWEQPQRLQKLASLVVWVPDKGAPYFPYGFEYFCCNYTTQNHSLCTWVNIVLKYWCVIHKLSYKWMTYVCFMGYENIQTFLHNTCYRVWGFWSSLLWKCLQHIKKSRRHQRYCGKVFDFFLIIKYKTLSWYKLLLNVLKAVFRAPKEVFIYNF